MIRNKARLQDWLKTVRGVVRSAWIPAEAHVEARGEIPDALVQQMRDEGLFRFLVPESYGGYGASCEELALVNMELSQCSVAFRVRLSNNIGVPAFLIMRGGSEPQKREWLPRLASGESLAGVGVTEPEYGSDAASMQTRAWRDSDEWVLDGEKAFITNGPIADVFVILARTSPERSGASGVSAFLVKKGEAGFTAGPAYTSMGQHGAPYSGLHLRSCRLPGDRLLGTEEGRGFRQIWEAFQLQRIQLAALSIGPALRLIDEGVRWAATRTQFGRVIGTHQLVMAKLADCQTEALAARALVLETARKYDEGIDVTEEASACKLFATEMVCRVADRIVQIFGARGYFSDFSCVERLYRDVRAARFAEGTSEIHQITIAREMLKRAGVERSPL